VHGPVPAGLFVLHHCDNRLCYNVDHLFLGTMQDNTDDMIAKGRGFWPGPRGERNGNSKLSHLDVARLLQYHSTGDHSQDALAERFGVAQSQISRALSGRSWTEVNERQPA
jgi:hypothetical protein